MVNYITINYYYYYCLYIHSYCSYLPALKFNLEVDKYTCCQHKQSLH